MSKIMTIFIALVALFLSVAGAVQPVMAGPYDGPDVRKDILIDKRVGIPHGSNGNISYEYVDNVSTDTYTYQPHEVVFFELRVRNTSNVDLIDVKISDFGPQYFELFENPGVLVDNQQILNLDAGDFEPNEEKVFVIRGRIFNSDNVPTGTTCITNRARAGAGSVADEDTAQFCFHKGETRVTKGGTTPVVTTETIPSTGPEHGLMIMGLASVLGYIGLRLRNAA
jgi:hypothetical protein